MARVKRALNAKKRHKAYKGHLTAKKTPARKRRLRKSTIAAKGDAKNIKRLLNI